MEAGFDLRRVREARADALRLAGLVKQLESLASTDPLRAAQALICSASDRRLRCQRVLRSHFGIEVCLDEKPHFRIYNPEFAPEDVGEFLSVLNGESHEGGKDRRFKRFPPGSAFSRQCFEAVFDALHSEILLRVLVEHGEVEEPARAVLDAFSDHLLTCIPGVFGLMSADPKEPAQMRSRGLAILTGWVRSRINWGRNKRIKAALSSDEDRLLEEIPSAVLVAWNDGGGLRGLPSLVTRVAASLEKLGREADSKSKVTDLEAPEAAFFHDDDIELLHFEAQETARQEATRERFWGLVERARLSKSERRVLEFDLRGVKTKEIAREMGNKEGTVKALRNRYKNKLLGAAA